MDFQEKNVFLYSQLVLSVYHKIKCIRKAQLMDKIMQENMRVKNSPAKEEKKIKSSSIIRTGKSCTHNAATRMHWRVELLLMMVEFDSVAVESRKE